MSDSILARGTRSADLVARVRSLAHEATRGGEAIELSVESLRLCEVHEEICSAALRLEGAIHLLSKEVPT